MPVITIKTLPPEPQINKDEILKAMIKTLSQAIDTPAEKIFAGWQEFSVQADGLKTASEFQQLSHPPIVEIRMFAGRSAEKKKKALDEIAACLRDKLAFAGHPFVYIDDLQPGQISTGGRVLG